MMLWALCPPGGGQEADCVYIPAPRASAVESLSVVWGGQQVGPSHISRDLGWEEAGSPPPKPRLTLCSLPGLEDYPDTGGTQCTSICYLSSPDFLPPSLNNGARGNRWRKSEEEMVNVNGISAS